MKKRKSLILELAAKYRDAGITPACPHFGSCGGCLFQDIAYGDQLLLKREFLNGVFEGAARLEEVRPSPPFRYRNRMDFVCAFGNTGLRRQGSHRHVVDIQSCAIQQERADSLYRGLLPFLKETESYNYLDHTGYLRYAVFRQGRFTGQVMASFVLAEREERLGPLLKAAAEADSVCLLHNGAKSDVSFGELFAHRGAPFIEESFDGVRYRIGPNSFFQSNSPVSLEIYRKIKSFARGRVLDLYCGVGSISLFVAGGVDHVTGIELVPEAVGMAEENRVLNAVENSRFHCADALAFMKEHREEYDTLVLDPPRGGMHPKMLRHIRELAPGRIIYLSCNPESFRREIPELPEYSLDSFEAFDMFPQTPHVETLAVLNRR